jgi:similar to spore coat protein
MEPQRLAIHEAMEVHELLNFKTICAARSKMGQGMVRDKDLKQLMEQDAQQSIRAIQALQAIYTRAPFNPMLQTGGVQQ